MTLKIIDCDQGTPEWLEARRGILTASVIGKLITPSRKQTAQNDTSRAVIRELAAERITGHIEDVYVSADMERGIWDEPFARAAYEEHFAPVKEVGFVVKTIDGNRLGYSPDGFVGDDGLIEIKSRRQHHQLATILNDDVPSFHMAQIQTGMLVTGRDWCDYISYSGGMPLFVKRVHPDDGWREAITKTLTHVETQIAKDINAYEAATAHLPATERTMFNNLPDLEF